MAEKSAPKGFSKGLVTDVDPRYQLEGSYRDAMNVKLVNADGTTFTIENINGNRQVLDLDTIAKTHIYTGSEVATTQTDNYFTDINSAPFDTDGSSMRGCANIVGHFSFRNELLLIVCGYLFWNQSRGSQEEGDFRTAFFKVVFDADGEVEKVIDLRVAYINTIDGNQFPNLNMNPLIKCRVEGIIENDSITRIYWTDNKNPLRTFSLNDSELATMDPSELDITPKAQHNQIALKKTTSGSLPVGVYQYCYKYITDSGSESGISPLSNIYHISNTSSDSYTRYYGGSPGSISNDGFLLEITDLDLRYDAVTIYGVYYNALGAVPQVTEVATRNILSDGKVEFRHTSLTEVIENGVENILIPTNTWDVCKDIAIKDNVLFAANLRQKRNFVTEREWNVKVKRYKITETLSSVNTENTGGSLLTNDDSIIDYTHPAIDSDNPFDINNVTAVNSATVYDPSVGLNGNLQHSTYRYLPNKGTCVYGNGKFLPRTNGNGAHRNILGGASHGYYSGAGHNGLGGCMFSFRQIPKVSDTIKNRGGINDSQTPFISTNVQNESLQTDNYYGVDGDDDSVETTYTASFSIGSNKDPHASGNKRGYQRGETYRFGVLVYDKNGDPGNVLWIGDIKMPEHYDKAWELDLENTELGRDAYSTKTKWKENKYAQDYRMSAHADMVVPGHGVQYDSTSYDTPSTEFLATTIYNNLQTYDSGMPPQIHGFVADGTAGAHYTLDLAVDFTFRIPNHVVDKISGFRVVRAERTDSDRTILQSGLINQICNYGNPSDLSLGYVSATQNGGINALPVEAGDTASIVAQNTDEIYDQVLNGYSGVNAGSNSVVAKDSDNKPRYINESESAMHLLKNTYGAGSGEFGSYGKGMFAESTTDSEKLYHVHTADRAGLMYSPDSTFGIRPYVFSGDHYLTITSIMKLYNEERSNNTDLQNTGTYIGPAFTFGYDSCSGILSSNSAPQGNFTTMLSGSTNSLQYQALGDSDDKRSQGLIFSTKKTTKDDESGVMVGKLAVIDTYFNPYCKNYATYFSEGYTTTQQYVKQAGVNNYSEAFLNSIKDIPSYSSTANSFTANHNPNHLYNVYAMQGMYSFQSKSTSNYISIINNSKEIGQGEFVSKDFFTIYKPADAGGFQSFIEHRGFSNFSLGARYLRSHMRFGNNWMYGKLNDGSNLGYETISTLQMGTRAILINTHRELFLCEDVMQVIKSQDYLWNKACKPIIDSDGLDAQHASVAQPYYQYGNIVRQNSGQYGGMSLEAIQKTRWVNAGNFHPINKITSENVQVHHSTVLGGDTFVGMYSHQITTSPYPEKSYSKWIVFPCESFVNTEMRSGLHLGANDHIEGFDQNNPPFSNDWFYNDVYSQENNLKSYLSLQDNDQEYTDLPVEIAFSKTKLSGEQTDAFRVFPIFNFYDVEAIYGQINRIINFQNEIHFFQENAFGQLLVNPRTFLQDTSGVDSIFTGSGDTIESHQYISIKYGTKHMHSVVASERNLFFFDIRFAKLLKYGSDKKLVSVSDDLGTRDLFEKAVAYGRLKSEERFYEADRVHMCDMPLYHVGIHGAFDYSSNSLYMTFSDRRRFDHRDAVQNPTETFDPYLGQNVLGNADQVITSSTIRFNEDINAVVSKYSVYPQQWIEHNGSLYTPKSRLPWISYEDFEGEPELIGGFRHSDDNNFGRRLLGVYGFSDRVNMQGYNFYTHELSSGALQLWQWEGSEEKTRFFDDIFLHNALSASGDFTAFYAEDSYPFYMTGVDSDGNLEYDTDLQNDLALRIIDKSYIEKIITDAPGENKKFDNLNIVATVKHIDNNSNNILAYSLDDANNSTVIRRGIENTDAGMYFEDLHFESDSFPRTRIDIRTTNMPGYPSATLFENTLHKYREGVLRIQLRNQESTQRVVGTYLSANLSARTTEKFNIFAIMAKYRKSYN